MMGAMTKLEIDDARQLVVATIEGPFGKDEVLDIVGRARAEAHARGYALLYDFSAASPGGISMGDIFWMPRRLPELAGATAARVRAALVHPPQFAEFARFWETAFTHSGLRARAFTDRAEAIEWLAKE